MSQSLQSLPNRAISVQPTYRIITCLLIGIQGASVPQNISALIAICLVLFTLLFDNFQLLNIVKQGISKMTRILVYGHIILLSILIMPVPVLTDKEILLRGAGASFPYPVYQRWIPQYQAYRQQHQKVVMQYDVTGSGTGKKRIMGSLGPPVEYAGSDSLLQEEDYDKHPDLQMLPSMAG